MFKHALLLRNKRLPAVAERVQPPNGCCRTNETLKTQSHLTLDMQMRRNKSILWPDPSSRACFSSNVYIEKMNKARTRYIS